MLTTFVTIELSPVKLMKLLPPVLIPISDGTHREGFINNATPLTLTAYDSLREKVTNTVVSDPYAPTELELTKDEAHVLFYASTIRWVDSYSSRSIIDKGNYPVIIGLVTAGFGYPQQKRYFA